MKLFVALVFLMSAVSLQPIIAKDNSKFIDKVGEFPITGSDNKIKVTSEGDRIQFRIRSSGPATSAIQSTSDWFIYTVDKDHFWVHLGEGRFYYYSWQSDNQILINEWTYPRMGKIPLPKVVEQRIKK
jgi:hypothetical protein